MYEALGYSPDQIKLITEKLEAHKARGKQPYLYLLFDWSHAPLVNPNTVCLHRDYVCYYTDPGRYACWWCWQQWCTDDSILTLP